MTENRTLESALYYISRGWAVIPVHAIRDGRCSCGKKDCSSPGKHPATPNGSKDASTDPELIRLWFEDGDWNVGIVCGKISNLVAVDCDGKTGEANFQKYKSTDTLRSLTGGGGSHRFYQSPTNGQLIKNSSGTFGSGLDVRGEHGYVVAPPSNHISGKEYRWERDPRAWSELPPCPDFLLDRKTKEAPAAAPGASVEEGTRNDTLTRLAGTLRNAGLGYDAIEKALQAENIERCKPPLPNTEIEQIATSVARYKRGKQKFNLTDVGNAERFAFHHKDKLRYIWNRKKWANYDEVRWNTETGAEVANQSAVETALSIVKEAEGKDREQRKRYLKWSWQSEASSRLAAILQHGKAVKPMPAYKEKFDDDAMLLNITNKAINLRR